MAWTNLFASSIDDLYKILNVLSDTQQYVFRGHASTTWDLVPSLHRTLAGVRNDGEKVLRETSMIRTFRRHARSLLQYSEISYFDRILDGIVLMQHYRAPTRLLDWTVSPWVACYFAAFADPRWEDHDAAVWAFNRGQLYEHNYRHRGARGYARFRALEMADTPEKWAEAALEAGSYIGVFRYQYANAQMTAQQSLFTISGQLGDDHHLALGRSLPQPWQTLKIIVPTGIKPMLRRRLQLMNVGALALFPTLDGVGHSVQEALDAGMPLDDEGLLWVLEANAAKRRAARRRAMKAGS